MGMRLRSKGNIDEVMAAFDLLQADIERAEPRVLTTLASQADVAGRRAIRDIYGISTADLAPYFDVEIASLSNPEARIVANGKGFPLRFFRPRKTKQGVEFTIKGKTVLWEHAFIATIRGGERQVFARGRYGPGAAEAPRRRRGRRKAGLAPSGGGSLFRATGERFGRFAFGYGRLPISLLRSSSPPDVLGNPDVLKAMNDRVEQQAPSVLARELKAAARGY